MFFYLMNIHVFMKWARAIPSFCHNKHYILQYLRITFVRGQYKYRNLIFVGQAVAKTFHEVWIKHSKLVLSSSRDWRILARPRKKRFSHPIKWKCVIFPIKALWTDFDHWNFIRKKYRINAFVNNFKWHWISLGLKDTYACVCRICSRD